MASWRKTRLHERILALKTTNSREGRKFSGRKRRLKLCESERRGWRTKMSTTRKVREPSASVTTVCIPQRYCEAIWREVRWEMKMRKENDG